jgi:diguanylate cyclase (GGDEF)-like protein
MSSVVDAAARLRALAEGFRGRCGGELHQMRRQLAAGGEITTAVDLLIPLLHRLAGSGATFGFDALSRRARALHDRLKPRAEHPDPADIPERAEIMAELVAMQRALENQQLPDTDAELQAVRRASLAGPLGDDPVLLDAAAFRRCLDTAAERARRASRPLTLALVSIDRWRGLVERRGRGAGKAVSGALSELLLQRVRRVDSVGRLRPGTFAVLLPDCSSDAAARLLDEVRERFAARRFRGSEDAGFSATLSAGMASAAVEVSPTALLQRADAALAGARHDGRNRIGR